MFLGALSLAIVGLTLAGCEQKILATKELRAVGPLRIGVGNTPDPPGTGDNRLRVEVRNAEGEPLRGAAVDVVVSMAAMGTMPYMESRGKVREVRPGVYEARYGLSMIGEWDVDLAIRPREGAPVTAAYRLSTSVRGLAFVGGSAAGDSAAMPAAGDSVVAVGGAVVLSAERRQEFGVRTVAVTMRDLSRSVRASGRIAFDERRQGEITTKFGGYVRDLRVDFVGRPVRRGEVLFTAYSPELWSAQQEYLEAVRVARADTIPGLSATSRELAEAARRRLQLWDLSDSQIDAIAQRGRPLEAVPILAFLGGVVVEKNVVRGSAFQAGQMLYRIAATDPIWIIASVFQGDLPSIRVGTRARVLDPYLDERSRLGRVMFVPPAFESQTRTADVRIEVPNPRGELRPGAFVDVELDVSLGPKLAVERSAVIPTGERHVVFVDRGGGRLEPRQVRLGQRAGDYVEVLDGLVVGDVVVTSGNFLVAAESRLRSATQRR